MNRAAALAPMVLVGLLLAKRKRKQEPVTGSDKPPTTRIPPRKLDDEARRVLAVQYALSEVGAETKDPIEYWRETMPGLSEAQLRQYADTQAWCGGFALAMLHRAGIGTDVPWEMGKGFCYRLETTNAPKPADIGYIHEPYRHHALVVRVDGDTVTTVDGNQERDTVKVQVRPRRAFSAFYSIQPLLDASKRA